jgi:hypothetical protein
MDETINSLRPSIQTINTPLGSNSMDPLKHDIKTKRQIEEALYDFLYAPSLTAFKSKLEALIENNSLTMRSKHKAFTYRGKTYTSETSAFTRSTVLLAEQYHPEMNQYLAELEELKEKEVPSVLGFINQILNSTNALRDYLKIMPASVHRPITSLIATCPCRAKSLTEEDVEKIKTKNDAAIQLIKQRLVNNLLRCTT